MSFHSFIRAGIACAWATLVIVWIVGLFFSKPTARQSSYFSRFVFFLPLIVFYLLVAFRAIPADWFLQRFWPHTYVIQALGLLITILGCGFAIWARLALGSNWSSLPKVKQAHELIVRGPYKLVRHPIYSGILLGLAGTAIVADRSVWIPYLVLLGASYIVKIRQEEQLMIETFPQDYPAYRRRVKALIPGLL